MPKLAKNKLRADKGITQQQIDVVPGELKYLAPASKRRTKTAKPNCSPKPHNTVFNRIAFRSVENMYASPSMVASPEPRQIFPSSALISSAA